MTTIQDEIAQRKAALLEKEKKIADKANEQRKLLREKENEKIRALKAKDEKNKRIATRFWTERDYLVMSGGGWWLSQMKNLAKKKDPSIAKALETEIQNYLASVRSQGGDADRFEKELRQQLENAENGVEEVNKEPRS